VAGRKVVVHNRTSRVVRIRSNGLVFRRNGCFFQLVVGGQELANSQFLEQALAPIKDRDLANKIRIIMDKDSVTPADIRPLFHGFTIEYKSS